MEEVVSQWARKDPTATAEWLNQFPAGELMDEPIQRFVREVVRKDPEIAMTWAEAIVDEKAPRNGRLPKSIGLPNAWPSKPRPLSRESIPLRVMGADREVEGPGGRGGSPFGQPR